MAKEIELSNSDRCVIVDDCDYARVSSYKWGIMTPRNSSGNSYAVGSVNGKVTLLHRFIMNPPKGMLVDHIDHNGLNCTRSNMRVCTRNENCRNRVIRQSNNKTGYKGVRLDKERKEIRFRAQITVCGKTINSGKRFSNPIDAAKEYDRMAKFYFGEFANVNFP